MPSIHSIYEITGDPSDTHSASKIEAGIRHGKKAISGHMLRHENFRLSANVLQLPEGD